MHQVAVLGACGAALWFDVLLLDSSLAEHRLAL
jgi:hypothetical protein